jgi:hypothetical protein
LPALLFLAVLSLCPLALLLTAKSARAETCPNADFRTGPSLALPDCRAYELVTPPYKEGYQEFSRGVSTSGEGVFGESLGNFAETGNSLFSTSVGGSSLSSLGSEYVFTRGGSGWTTTPIEPPASLYPLSALAATSSDLGASLWFASTSAQIAVAPLPYLAQGSLVLHHGDGPLTEVGPVYPPSVSPASVRAGAWNFVAASSDLSHVLFTASAFRWPGDTTTSGGASLYEYAGTGNAAPRLVGVSGGTGSASSISLCATMPGAGNLVASGLRLNLGSQHVISADGTTAFFTAEACGSLAARDEPFARVEGDDPATRWRSPSLEADLRTVRHRTGRACPLVPSSPASGAARSLSGHFAPLLGDDLSPNVYAIRFRRPAAADVRISAGIRRSRSTANVPLSKFLGGDRARCRAVLSGGLKRRSGNFAATGMPTAALSVYGQVARPGTGQASRVRARRGTPRAIYRVRCPLQKYRSKTNDRRLTSALGGAVFSGSPARPASLRRQRRGPQAFEYDS